MERRTDTSVFSACFEKLSWHRGSKQKQGARVVYNNVALEQTSEHDIPPQKFFKTNIIKTTKYTILTFLPKNLFEQFHRFANIYFLFIALLNFIPAVAAFGQEIALIPVIGVLMVTGMKDGYEDYRRYQQDKKVNTTKCLVYKKSSSIYEEERFSNVLVGDIVRVKCNQVIPADLLILGCSEESSTCFIETANLDGESNLKQRTAVSLDDSGVFIPQTKLKVECETPNAVLNKFNGYIQSENGQKKLLSKDNLLLRGCVLRNTDYIEGIVIYAGHDTKAMMNSSGPRYKRSKLETNMNRDVLWCLIILLFLCFFSATGSAVWLKENSSSPADIPYIPPDKDIDYGNPALEGVIRFWTFIILYQVMIPLSLYATLEIVKSCQVYFIHHDIKMYYEEGDIQPVCRALNITEDLGQVQHVFSDKTGTLTENKMAFKACSVGEILFREEEKSNGPDDETQLSNDPLFNTSLGTSVLTSVANDYTQPSTPHGSSQAGLSESDISNINEFLILLATCNTVVVSSHSHMSTLDTTTGGSTDSLDTAITTPSNGHRGFGNLNGSAAGSTLDVPMTTFTPVKNAFRKITDRLKKSFNTPDEQSNVSLHSMASGSEAMLSKKTLKSRYEAESPDELALVNAVCNYGCRLLSRTNDYVSVFLPAQDKITFKVLAILPFDSTRKCMSVVMQRENSDQIIMYTKGADNMIFEKIKDDEPNQALLKKTRVYVNHFAKDGLRTLCMAKKVMSEEEFYTWYEQYANCDMEDREAEQFRLSNELECDLELLGATGIEDKLQEGVAESISALEAADIKVWVLTGDKQETAINIGYSCGLLPREAAILTLNVPNADEVYSVLHSHLIGITSPTSQAEHIPRCLVVDGKTLGHIFPTADSQQNKNLSRMFLKLAESCLSVLCCRTTPSQKAKIVDLVKTKSKKLTLSIGDGANDVNMIRTANIGVGIEGLEGKQASMAADFSIGRFRYLVRLLFVHGHWSYDRLAVMTLYNFFKNSNLIFVLFWYQIYCMFSGQSHIDQIYLIVFHLLFTSLPPIVMGILDQDLPDTVLMSHPRLYKQGPLNKLYHNYSYWLQILDSLYQSLTVFFVSYLHYSGMDIGLWSLGTIQTITLVIAQWSILLIETRSWHWPFVTSNIVSVLCFWLFITILGATCVLCNPPSNPYWVVERVLMTSDAWLVILWGSVVCVVPRLVCMVAANMFYPTDVIHTRSLVLGNKMKSEENIHFPVNPSNNIQSVDELTVSA